MPVSVAARRPSASSSSRSPSLYTSNYTSRYTSLTRSSVTSLDLSSLSTRSVRHGSVSDDSSGLLSRYSSLSRERSSEPRGTDRSSREPSKSRLDSSTSSSTTSSAPLVSRRLEELRARDRDTTPSYSKLSSRPPMGLGLHSSSATSSASSLEDSSRTTPSYARSRSSGVTSSTAAPVGTMTTSTGKPFHSRFLKPKPVLPAEDSKAIDKAEASGSDRELAREEDDDHRNNNSVTDNGASNGAAAQEAGDDADDDNNGNENRRPSVALLRQKFINGTSTSSPAPTTSASAPSSAPSPSPSPAPSTPAPPSESRVRDDAQTAPLAGGHEDPSRLQRVTSSSSSSPAPSDSENYDSPRLSRRAPSFVANGSRGSGLNGLRNIGNTCFMNSVIQCLSNTRPLLEYLLKQNYMSEINKTNSSMKGALIKAFAKMIEELWTGEGQVINTSTFKGQIQHFAPRFMGYSQQDAQEFLRYLLEGLHEDVNRVEQRPTNSVLPDIDDALSDNQKADESWRRYLRIDDSSVLDVFVGQLKSTLKCTVCGHCSVTFDPFWDLSLPIPSRTGQLRLQQCLEHFTREEVLDGDEKPTCAKCQTRRKCTKSFSIQKFPKILVLHLKRFSPTERFRGKLNVTVEFPLSGLDLSAYAANRGRGCTYNLYGVANHSGTTYSGHYTAYCKHPYSHEWHEYNDSRVSSIQSRNVVSSEAYVLFYELSGQTSHL